MKRGAGLTLVVLAILCGLAIWVRWAGMQRQLGLDEYATAWAVRDSVADIFPRSWVNNLTPLYFLFVYAATRACGYSEIGLRSVSLAAGVLLIPAVWRLVRLLGGSFWACFFAGWLVAFDVNLIEFSIEARPYALVQLVGVLQIATFCELDKRGNWNVALFGLLSAVLAYLHYTALLILCVEAAALVAAALVRRQFDRKQALGFAAGSGMLAVLLLPMLTHLFYLAHNRNVLGSFVPVEHYANGLSRFHALNYLYIPVLGGLLVDRLVNRSSRQKLGGDAAAPPVLALVLTALWVVLPPTALWVSTRCGLARLDVNRYAALSNVAVVIAPAIFVQAMSSRTARIWLVSLVVLLTQLTDPRVLYYSLRGNWQSVNPSLQASESWKNAARLIRERVPANCPVFIQPALVEREYLDHGASPLVRSYLLSVFNSIDPLSPEQLARCTLFNRFESIDALAAAQPERRGFAIVVRDVCTLDAQQAAERLKRLLPPGSVVETWTTPKAKISVVWVGRPTSAN